MQPSQRCQRRVPLAVREPGRHFFAKLICLSLCARSRRRRFTSARSGSVKGVSPTSAASHSGVGAAFAIHFLTLVSLTLSCFDTSATEYPPSMINAIASRLSSVALVFLGKAPAG